MAILDTIRPERRTAETVKPRPLPVTLSGINNLNLKAGLGPITPTRQVIGLCDLWDRQALSVLLRECTPEDSESGCLRRRDALSVDRQVKMKDEA